MSISNRTIRTALPIIASTLCQKFGVQIELQGDTAYTNGKRIVLPALMQTTVDPTIVYGYLLHESGHVRFSEFGIETKHANKALHHAILNILEDGRIEHAMCEKYPGGFHWVKTLDAHLLMSPDAMGGEAQMKAMREPLNVLMAYIYFYTRCKAAGLVSLYQNQLNQIEQELEACFGNAFKVSFTNILAESLSAKSTRELGAITDRLIDLMLQFCMQNAEPNSPQESTEKSEAKSSSGSSSDEQKDAEGNENSGSQSQDQSGTSPSNGVSSDKPGKEKKDEKGGKDQKNKNNKAADGSPSGGAEEGNAENAESDRSPANGEGKSKAAQVMQALLDADQAALDEATQGTDASLAFAQDLTQEGHQHGNPNAMQTIVKPTNFLNGLNKPPQPEDMTAADQHADEIMTSAKLIARRLERSLRSKVEALARTKRCHSERGNRLSASRLASFVTGNTRVFVREGERQDVNTAVHIMIDMSGSMCGGCDVGAKKAACAFALACASIKGINVGVSGFTSRRRERTVQTFIKHGEQKITTGLESLSRFEARGGTPAQDAILAAQYQLLNVRDVNRRILMFITDGDVLDAEPLIRRLKPFGIESRALFIDGFCPPGLFDREARADSQIKDDELASRILDLMSNAVLQ